MLAIQEVDLGGISVSSVHVALWPPMQTVDFAVSSY
jgi:hypothetical protein